MNLFSEPSDAILLAFEPILEQLKTLEIESKIETINQLKLMLHQVSPMRNEPVDCVIWVPNENVRANDYNPNSVAPPEMELLKVSILEDGYTQPIVAYQSGDQMEVVDGFHRNRVGKECKEVKERVLGYLPIVAINQGRTDKGDRMASTIRHNRARGKHRIDSMSEIVIDLKRRNWSNERIARDLGMDADEILRLSQISGIAEMFADAEFAEAWEIEAGNTIEETDTLSVIDEIEE